MRDDRLAAQQQPQKQPAPQRKPQAASDERRGDQQQRKVGPVDRSEWRGSGVCGDRHTD
jgi:hypothetical protein